MIEISTDALERARVVAVLDAWAAQQLEICGVGHRIVTAYGPKRREGRTVPWVHVTAETLEGGRVWLGNGPTPDEARAAAAKAIESGEV